MASGRSNQETGDISLLGNQHTQYPTDYAPEMLETFPNKHPDRDYFVKFNCPEFTSLCPITGQPDFATLYISYVPRERMVESKSLKLYLFSFRNRGDFHEDCVNIIMNDLIKLMDPAYIEVWGKFLPRGGISIDPAQSRRAQPTPRAGKPCICRWKQGRPTALRRSGCGARKAAHPAAQPVRRWCSSQTAISDTSNQ